MGNLTVELVSLTVMHPFCLLSYVLQCIRARQNEVEHDRVNQLELMTSQKWEIRRFTPGQLGFDFCFN